MIALPPVPPIDVQPVDFEIQAPNADALALRSVIVELFGVQLNEQERVLTLKPAFPVSWNEKDAALTTSDFDFSCKWNEHICTWSFEGFGAYAESYDSIVVYAPDGTLMAGELADEEGVTICYYRLEEEEKSQPADLSERKLTRKEKRELAKREKERKKRESAESKKKKK